jgi:hypothetical protein
MLSSSKDHARTVKKTGDQRLFSKDTSPKKYQGKYAETTLIEDVLEANK